MARITKNPEERKNELIDTAEELFKTVGYEKTAISDIVKKIGVAQGTFYYYFKSKEQIFQAIFHRQIEKDVVQLEHIMKDTQLGVMEKYNQMWMYQFHSIKNKIQLTAQLHVEENIGMHQKVNVERVKEYTKVYAQLIEQGVQEGIIQTNFPFEAAEILMLVTNFLFDPGVFEMTKDQYVRKLDAFDEFTRKIFCFPNENQEDNQIREVALSLYDYTHE